MSAAAPAPARRRPAQPRPKAAPKRAAPPRSKPASGRAAVVRPRRLSAGGLVWLLVLATLLGGLVFLNVAALRASMDVSRLSASAQAVQQANRGLSAQIATLAAPYRIDRQARRLGMVQQSPSPGDQLPLRPHRHRTARALKR